MTSIKNSAGTLLPRAFVCDALNRRVRTVQLDGEPYFVAKDICDVLGISNHNDAVGRLDDDERRGSVMPTPSGTQLTTVVNESGLYHLIFQSRKPEARLFRRWVTSEVLPALRRTGRYALTGVSAPATSEPYRRAAGTVRPREWHDLRSELCEREPLFGGEVRSLRFDGATWYSIGDALRALGLRTEAWRRAEALSRTGRTPVRRLLLFGASAPSWFCTWQGLRLLAGAGRHAAAEQTLFANL